MKHHLTRFIPGLFLLVFYTLTTSCALIVSEVHQPHHPRHRQRIVWVSGVSYRQVYYIQNHNVMIVSQQEEPQKPHKVKRPKGHNGRHGGH